MSRLGIKLRTLNSQALWLLCFLLLECLGFPFLYRCLEVARHGGSGTHGAGVGSWVFAVETSPSVEVRREGACTAVCGSQRGTSGPRQLLVKSEVA